MRKIYIKSLKKSPKIKKRGLKGLALKVLELENAPRTLEIGIIIVDNSYIQKLNQKYRKIDSPTNVLAFQLEVPGKGFWGDVYISLDMAILQTPENESLEFTLSRYLIHGILHLLGYKHGKQMSTREEHYLKEISNIKNQISK